MTTVSIIILIVEFAIICALIWLFRRYAKDMKGIYDTLGNVNENLSNIIAMQAERTARLEQRRVEEVGEKTFSN